MSIRFRSVNANKHGKPLFSNVSFDIQDGEIVYLNNDDDVDRAILNVIAGLEKVSSGAITISGYDLDSMSGKEKTAFFRNTVSYLRGYFLQSNLTVHDNIALPGMFLGMPWREINSRVESIAKKFDITNLLKKKPNFLSDEEKEKVCVARTLFVNPKIILAIEPSEWAIAALSDYTREKSAIFLITSNNSDLEKFATRTLRIERQTGGEK